MFRNMWPSLALTALLAACGGGGSSTTVELAPLPTTPAVVADVTLTQATTLVAVTPGETFRTTILEISCPLAGDEYGSCKKQVSLGEIGINADLELQGVQFLHDGAVMDGFVQHEGSLYRFIPFGYNPIWKTGSIEVVATLSPTAPSGAKTLVVAHVATASFDKEIALVSAEAKIEVLALAHYAPAAITVGGDPANGVTSIKYSCPTSVMQGCRLESSLISVSGVPGTEARVFVNGEWRVQMWTDANGYVMAQVTIDAQVPAGGTVVVEVSATPSDRQVPWTVFRDIKSWSGGKLIAPVLPPECSAANLQNCKG